MNLNHLASQSRRRPIAVTLVNQRFEILLRFIQRQITAEKKKLVERHYTVIEHLHYTTTITTKLPLIIHCDLCV